MRQFGIAPNVRADESIDTLEFKIFKAQTKHVYSCSTPNCEHHVGNKVHTSLQFGSTYTCKLTGGKLTGATFLRTERKSAAQRKAEAYKRAGKALPGAPGAAKPPKAPTKRRPTSSSPSKVSKKDRAEALYRGAKGQARPDIIAIFMSQLDMTAAGAATYYANCKKTFG